MIDLQRTKGYNPEHPNTIDKPEQSTRAKPRGYPTKEQFKKLEPLLDGRITEQPNTELKDKTRTNTRKLVK